MYIVYTMYTVYTVYTVYIEYSVHLVCQMCPIHLYWPPMQLVYTLHCTVSYTSPYNALYCRLQHTIQCTVL